MSEVIYVRLRAENNGGTPGPSKPCRPSALGYALRHGYEQTDPPSSEPPAPASAGEPGVGAVPNEPPAPEDPDVAPWESNDAPSLTEVSRMNKAELLGVVDWIGIAIEADATNDQMREAIREALEELED